jgi:hypothetical protein
MSRIPSNTEQFLSGIAAGTQNIGQATQNFAASEQAAQGRMGLQLEQEKMRQQGQLQQEQMRQQGQQFQQGLQAEAENYRKLNESRERMQAAEMAQQGAQFQQRMQFDAEQARVERMLAVKLKQHEMDMMALDREIAATASNDPRILELRAKRREARTKARDMEQMIAAAGQSQQLAQGVRTDRLDEVSSRLTAMQEAIKTRSSAAAEAVLTGFNQARLVDSASNNFFAQMGRAAAIRTDERQQDPLTAIQPNSTPVNMAMYQLYDEIKQFFLGEGAANAEFAEMRATDFMKNGGAMAVETLTQAMSLNREAFGLKPGEMEKAQALVQKMLTDATILANLDPRVHRGGNEAVKMRRQRIAQNLGELRNTGMGDEQITALFEGLDSLSSNRPNILATYVGEGEAGSPEALMMNRTLEGVGKIADMVQGVGDDQELMGSVGGTLKDLSKYDFIGTMRRAQAAYGMGQESAQIQNLMNQLQGYGASDAEIAGLVEALTMSDPNLQYLRPEDYMMMIKGMQQQGYNIQDLAEAIDEQLGQTQAEVMAGRQAQMFQQGSANLEQQLGGILGL